MRFYFKYNTQKAQYIPYKIARFTFIKTTSKTYQTHVYWYYWYYWFIGTIAEIR